MGTPAGEERSRRYNIAGFWPTAFFDGFYRSPQVPEKDSFYSIYNDMIGQAGAVKSVLEVSFDSATTTLDSTELRLGVHITPTDSSVDGLQTLMLAAVVFEDSVPYVSVLSGDTVYARYCARCVIGDTWGVPVAFHFGTDYDTVLTTPLGDWNRSRLGVAVLIQDTSNLRVMQSAGKLRF